MDTAGILVKTCSNIILIISHIYTRACLKIHSRHPYAPLCGRFAPYSVAVARYSALMRNKSPISYPWVQTVTQG